MQVAEHQRRRGEIDDQVEFHPRRAGLLEQTPQTGAVRVAGTA
jgi:hypothetical protein